jgi:uncharacterized protein
MKLSVQDLALETYLPALRTLSTLLDKGAEHWRAKGADPASLLGEKLAPDMLPLAVQVKLACLHARSGTARITGQQPPDLDRKERNFAELKELIDETIGAVTELKAEAFEGGEDRKVQLSLQDSRVFESNGVQLLLHWSFPHFYFHVVTAYDILRHVGVKLGKLDYMRAISGGYVRELAKA